ncbi:hypothetical protein [Croceibacterium aestuarii]|uniref:hypothetical protein n=1 Tax=Croceibacterium aestuarii TaxID=3064139 RepID=UPI00272DCB6C|nr:hypothetical protein [Croceibacterium sp. D39]
MRTILLTAVLLLAATGASAQQAAQLNADQKVLLRCSAAFALAANMQEHGDKTLGEIPELRARGKEYFVRAMASLMDQQSLDREQVSALLKAEVAALSEGDALPKAMPECLASLQASGL